MVALRSFVNYESFDEDADAQAEIEKYLKANMLVAFDNYDKLCDYLGAEPALSRSEYWEGSRTRYIASHCPMQQMRCTTFSTCLKIFEGTSASNASSWTFRTHFVTFQATLPNAGIV